MRRETLRAEKVRVLKRELAWIDYALRTLVWVAWGIRMRLREAEDAQRRLRR